jgi:hypothetical protein
MRRAALLIIACLAILALGSSLGGQSATGQINGTVTDASGANISGAPVTLTNQQTGQTKNTKTTEGGAFAFPLLPVGQYSISIEQKGFKAEKRSDIQLNVEQIVRIDISLQVGNVTESVDVKASTVNIDTETAEVSQVVSQKQVSELPLNGRNFLQLLFLGAGAVQTSGEQGSMRQGVLSAISINGARPTSNNYLLDGTSNTDTALNTAAVVLSVDAIQEFKEQTANYSAEYGFSANQINIISKSGSNDLHGALFWFGRNNDLDARSFFNAGIPNLRQNQFGFVAAGPVYIPKIYHGRNKTFWMANYEGERIRQGTDTKGIVPTADLLAGKFTASIIDPVTGQPFPNNTIPSSRWARASKVALSSGLYPAPNLTPTGSSLFNYQSSLPIPTNQDQQTYRLDQNLGRFGNVYGRYTKSNFDNTSPGFTSYANVFFIQDSTNWQISHSVTIGPHVVNQFRYGYVEATANQQGVAAPQSAVDAMALTGVFTGLPDSQRTWPSFGVTGFSGVGGAINAYTTSNQPMHDMSDDLTWIHGNHTIALGISYRNWKLQRDLANNFLGNFSYTGLVTGAGNATANPQFAFADFLLGEYQNAAVFQPAGFSVAGKTGNPREYNFQYIAPFVQDDWKITPRLTLNLGIRWDFRTMPYETNNRMGWLDVTNPLGGMCIADPTLVSKGIAPVGGFYRYCGRRNPADASKKPFAPRFGFAYRPFGGDKTVVRGGYGVFFDSAEGREIDGSADIYPYVSRGTYTQASSQTTFATTDSLFPSFASLGPVTPAANSFIAVIISERPKNPYVQQWSLSVSRQLTSNTTLEVNYIGNKGTNLLMRRNIAQVNQPSNPAFCAASAASAKLSDCPIANRLPYQNFGVYINSDWSGNSNYEAGTVKLQHQSGSFLFTTAYTWSKSIDNKSAAAGIGSADTGWQGFLNNHDVRRDRGLSDFDVDHRIVSSFVYNLPFGRSQKYMAGIGKLTNAAVGGWQINGIATFQKGFPYPIFAQDVGGNLQSFSNRANLVGNPHSGFTQSLSQWFNTAAFSQPAAFFYGNSGRNILRGPGINNWDLSLFKNFGFTEKINLQLRLESFNTLNHAQWNTPDHNMADANFGRITSARDGRINQVGVKIVF